MNLNAGQAVQAQSTAGKPQDSTTPDTPFSQVLSSEIAQTRNRSEANSEAHQDTGTQAGQDAASPAGRPAEDAAASANDPLNPAPVGAGAVDPKTALALAINPDQLNLASAVADEVDAGASEPAANALLFQGSRKGRTLLAVQAAENSSATQKADLALPGKATPLAATQAATATAFSGQLAEIHTTKAMKTGDALSELMSNPAMRPATHSPLETLHTANEIAAPRLAPAVGTTAWGQALGDKIVWMATAAQQTATLTLNPPNMGPLQIVLNVSNEQATASFFSAQPEVRQALEAAFPRLKEMMNEAGIQLGQATVSADTPRQDASTNRQGQPVASPFFVADDPAATALQTGQVSVQHSGRGLIDTFA
ncbi:flagellar hook-length control protein FliK [Thiobacillus sp.]